MKPVLLIHAVIKSNQTNAVAKVASHCRTLITMYNCRVTGTKRTLFALR